MYLELLKKYKEQYGFKLFSFALIPNQICLLAELKGQATISVLMHDVTSSYTKYFNNRYERKGHLFQERFKSVVVEKGPYLSSMVSYIHKLPIKSGLAQAPEEYAYSSHNLYLYHNSTRIETAKNIQNILTLENEIEEVLKAITEASPDKKSYADFIRAIGPQETEELSKKLYRAGILGSEQFVGKVKSQLENKQETLEVEERSLPLVPVISISIAVLLSGAGLGFLYLQKHVSPKTLNNSRLDIKETPVVSIPAQNPVLEQKLLTGLDGTEWIIEVAPMSKTAAVTSYFDKLEFKKGMLFSKEMSEKGFLASNYTLTTQDNGTLVWETMQKNNAGDTIFWRAETTTDGKMSGVLSKHPVSGISQEVLFTSVSYRRKE